MHYSFARFVVAASIVAAWGTGVRADTTPLTLDDVARIKNISAATVSVDGNKIAYLVERPRDPFQDEDGPAWTELMVIVGDVTARRYLSGAVNVSDVVWNADGTGLYFLAKRDGEEHNALYAMPTDGGEAQVLCRLPERDIGAFDIHPDGRRAAILAKPSQPKAEKLAEEHGFKAVVYEESLRAQQLAVLSVAVDMECAPQPLAIPEHVTSAVFAPDGQRILAKVVKTPLIDDSLMLTRLRVIDMEGSEITAVNNLGKLGDARWSPDSSKVAFLGVNDFNDPATGRLKIADARDGSIRTLLFGLEGHVMDLAWAGDDAVFALIHFGVESEVWRVPLAAAGEPEVLVPRGDLVVDRIAASGGGHTMVMLASSVDHPRELFRWRRGKSLERLTDSNPWLSERRLGRQIALDYAASDGLGLQGLVVYPVDFREGRRYPLLIFVHGGPESHRSNNWLTSYSSPIQVAAGAGYMSFVPNYRGSTGRGVEFSKLDQHGYARPEFDDIVDGKNHLVAMGLVDAKRVGITGGSYGGYATAWSATALSEHYAAGVMFVGISDQISKFGTTDIPREMHAVHARAWPWEDWQFMLERSPIYHVQNSRTPLLIMHGDADPRVHPSQSLQLYRYLKLAGHAPVRLVWYPGEGHGNQKAAARYDYSQRLMRWMDHYLKGEGGEAPGYEIDYSDRLTATQAEGS